MQFTARASSKADFDSWVKDVRLSPDMLDTSEYESLLRPSENNQAAYFSSAGNDLYDNVFMKYSGSTGGHADANHKAAGN